MLYPPWFCPGNASPLALKRGGPGSVHRRGEPSTCSKCSRFSNFLQNVHTACYTQSGSNLIGVTPLPNDGWGHESDSICTCIQSYIPTKVMFSTFTCPWDTAASAQTPGVKSYEGSCTEWVPATPYAAIYLTQFNCLRAGSLTSFYRFTPETTERHWSKRVHR